MAGTRQATALHTRKRQARSAGWLPAPCAAAGSREVLPRRLATARSATSISIWQKWSRRHRRLPLKGPGKGIETMLIENLLFVQYVKKRTTLADNAEGPQRVFCDFQDNHCSFSHSGDTKWPKNLLVQRGLRSIAYAQDVFLQRLCCHGITGPGTPSIQQRG